MSKNDGLTGEWDNLWKEYTKALEKWREVFELFQKTTSDMHEKYNELMKKAATDSSKDAMKQFGENWQKAMKEAGISAFNQFNENWQKAMNEWGTDAFKQFGKSWQMSMNESGLESMRVYGEMMTKFAETWNKMWPK